MRTDRLGQLCFLSFAILGACSRSAPSPALLGKGTAAPVIATFEGSFDPATSTFSVRAVPVVSASGEALVAFPPWQDGSAGSGPDNTLELVTEASPAPGEVVDGCGVGVNSFEGAITVRSFYLHQTFSNLYIELTNVAPTGFEACNSDPEVTGVGNSFGLWSYGTIGRKGAVNDHATRTWRFRFANSQAFTFQGRIMANLGAPVAQGGDPEFDWWPGAIVTPPHSFQDVPTTRAHLVWNGSTFVDTRGLISFVPQGSTPPSTTIGLWDPAQPMVGPFGSTSFFIADAAHGGNAIDTSGDFTVCVKFKPGVQPGFVPPNPNKILVAKGFAEAADPTDGWALMQMHDEYCFHYRTAADLGRNDVMSYTGPQTSHPEAYTFDYICGGRVGNVIHSGAHGRSIGIDESETGTFAAAGAGLPLAIGAYPDGTNPATDVGIYEVIFDSRPATLDVMNDIVSDAEGRKLPGSQGGSATYLAALVDGTSIPGADGLGYVLPAYATNPFPMDGSGLLAEGTVVKYSHPLTEDTSTTGFCLGAEIVANGAWSNVSGGFLHAPGVFDVVANPFLFGSSFAFAIDEASAGGWAPGSAHTLKACVAPGVNTTLYADGALTTTGGANTPVPSLGDPTITIEIGHGGGPLDNPNPLSGARIRRVFVCPGSNPALCN